MSTPEFEPKIGRIKGGGKSRSTRLSLHVVKAATRQRGSPSRWAGALTRRPVRELARGKGALYGLSPPPAGWRRAVVKARIARHGPGLGAARAHLHYIMRDGVSPGGEPGRLYDRDHEGVDPGGVLERQVGDTYQFRFIVAPEDGAQLASLQPFVRDLMAKMEDDLHTRLDWVAVDHYNTGHPHTHIVIAGRDDKGQDLVMARDYIANGIRHRAQDLLTYELGPELEFDRLLKRVRDVSAERLTATDRSLLHQAEQGILVVQEPADGDRQRHASMIGRLRRLEDWGLADEKRTGVWQIDPELEPKLRDMGERGDIHRIMHKALDAAGRESSAGDFEIFAGAPKSEPLIGRVAEVGLADEFGDRHYVVIDGIDGRVHYAAIGAVQPSSAPERGMIVSLTGAASPSLARTRPARVEILSYRDLDTLPAFKGETWLDRVIVAKVRPVIREQYFGAALAKALGQRESWLIANGHAQSLMKDTITPNRGMLTTLSQLGRSELAQRLSRELDRTPVVLGDGGRFVGRHVATIDLPTERLAVIRNTTNFTLMRAQTALEQVHGHDIALQVSGRQIALSLARGRERDLGPSR